MLSLQSFLREGRVGGLCWENQNLKDLKGYRGRRFGFDTKHQSRENIKSFPAVLSTKGRVVGLCSEKL